MLVVSISDNSFEVLKISRFLWWRSFSYISRREFPTNLKEDKLAKNLKEIGLKNDKCFLSLPDSKILIYRFEIPSDLSGEALKTAVFTKVKELTPDEIFDDLVYDYKVDDSRALFLAVPREVLTDYVVVFKLLNLTPVFATSESLALWETIRQTIIEDETVILVEVGEKTSQISFFDLQGPILDLKKEVKTLDLEEETKRARRDFWKKQGTMVKRIILADPHEIYQHKGNNGLFSQAVGIWTNDLKNILEDKLKNLGISYNFANLSLTSFSRTIGLALLAQDKNSLNLLSGKAKSPKPPKSPKVLKLPKETKEDESRKTTKAARTTQLVFLSKFIDKIKHMRQFVKNVAGHLRKRRVKLLLLILGSSLIAFSLVWLVFAKGVRLFSSQSSPSLPREAPEGSEVGPTPTPPLKRESLKIKLLNGSGKRGAAVTAAKFLKEKGYTQIEIGNADRFDYQETTISLKEEKQNYLDLLREDLKSEYKLASEAASLAKEEDFDLVVIVGRNRP